MTERAVVAPVGTAAVVVAVVAVVAAGAAGAEDLAVVREELVAVVEVDLAAIAQAPTSVGCTLPSVRPRIPRKCRPKPMRGSNLAPQAVAV
jgi:hypothetical protein